MKRCLGWALPLFAVWSIWTSGSLKDGLSHGVAELNAVVQRSAVSQAQSKVAEIDQQVASVDQDLAESAVLKQVALSTEERDAYDRQAKDGQSIQGHLDTKRGEQLLKIRDVQKSAELLAEQIRRERGYPSLKSHELAQRLLNEQQQSQAASIERDSARSELATRNQQFVELAGEVRTMVQKLEGLNAPASVAPAQSNPGSPRSFTLVEDRVIRIEPSKE